MIDREKVIKGLECCMNDGSECYEPSNGKCPYYKDDVSESTSTCTDDLFYDIYALLKAQEPVEPIQDMVGDALFLVCGKCGHDIRRSDWYCANCGKAVKWDG